MSHAHKDIRGLAPRNLLSKKQRIPPLSNPHFAEPPGQWERVPAKEPTKKPLLSQGFLMFQTKPLSPYRVWQFCEKDQNLAVQLTSLDHGLGLLFKGRKA